MSISLNELARTIGALETMRRNVPWYRPMKRARLKIMKETLIGIAEWIVSQPAQRSCGCATHTNPGTN